MTNPDGPLKGVKVVACSTAQAGTVPYMLMADLGAEVIKIEVPEGGDTSRVASVLPGHPSSFFETNNRGVKSVTLNLKAPEGREILRKLVARADIFGQNFRPGAAEKNGFGYEELKKVNPKLVYISISGYGPKGPNAHLPGTDSMAQALGGIAQAYAAPGQPMSTGIASVADETCAILAFGGALAALTHARATGVGQKVELLAAWQHQFACSAGRSRRRLWRGTDPVTGQARVAGTRERPAMSASFNDRDGKPMVFQLGGDKWKEAMVGLGFYAEVEKAGFSHLGEAMDSDGRRAELLALLDRAVRDRHARPLGGQAAGPPISSRRRSTRCSRRPRTPMCSPTATSAEVDYPKHGKRLRVHGTPWQFSETPAKIGLAPELGEHNDEVLTSLGYSDGGRFRAFGSGRSFDVLKIPGRR